MLIGLCLVALLWLIPSQIETATGEYDLSPAFFPRLGVMAVLVLAVCLLLARLRQPRVSTPTELDGPRPHVIAETAAWSAASLVVMMALQWAGFFPTSVAVIIIGAWLCGRRDWLRIVSLALLFPWLVQTATWQIFTVSMP